MDLLNNLSSLPFYILATTAVVCSLGMIFLANLVRASFLLIGAFSAIAGLYFLLAANFVAVSQVLIYAVGIVLVIIFAVMLCSLQEQAADVADPDEGDKQGRLGRKALAIILSTGIFATLTKIILSQDWSAIAKLTGANRVALDKAYPVYTGQIGFSMLNNNLLAFELVSVLLLIVLVGVIILSKKEIESKEA